jgi:hypothetical protein
VPSEEQIVEDINSMKVKVKTLLETYPRARNDDKFLYVKLLQDAYPGDVTIIGDGARFLIRWSFHLDELGQMPNMHTVLRVRRKVQEEYPELMPTDPLVLYHRRFREEVIRATFSNQPQLLRDYDSIRFEVK